MSDPSPGGRAESTEESLALETAFDLLAEERRRHALYRMVDAGGALTTDELAARTAASKRRVDVEDVPARTREAVLKELFHVDLPKLADAGASSSIAMRDASVARAVRPR